MTRIILFFLILSFVFTASSQAAEFIQLGHLEILGAYSGLRGDDGVSGASLSAYYSPVLKFNNTLFLIPLYTVQYQRIRRFLPEDEGNHLSNTYLVHNATLSLRKEFKPRWFIKISAIGTWNFVKETNDEKWGEGLYDYRDAGCSIDLRHKKDTGKNRYDYTAGFEYYRRQYPNYQSLISLVTVTPPEVNEKDFDGFKLSWRYEKEYRKSGLVYYLKPYFLHKQFIDKRLVRDDGTLDASEKRQDEVFGLDYGLEVPLSKGFSLCMDNNYVFDSSDLGYYDTRDTVALADDVFTPHYYSYHAYKIAPAIKYEYPLEYQKEVRVKLGYYFLDRYYTDRKFQMSDGAYSQDEMRTLEHCLEATVSWPLTEKIDLVARFSYIWARSNQKYEQYYKYNYDTYSIETGISFDF